MGYEAGGDSNTKRVGWSVGWGRKKRDIRSSKREGKKEFQGTRMRSAVGSAASRGLPRPIYSPRGLGRGGGRSDHASNPSRASVLGTKGGDVVVVFSFINKGVLGDKPGRETALEWGLIDGGIIDSLRFYISTTFFVVSFFLLCKTFSLLLGGGGWERGVYYRRGWGWGDRMRVG